MTPARILLLPGWQNSDADHWQSHWQRDLGFERLQQDDWWWPRRGDWMARLDETLRDGGGRPTVLVAHSLGCHLVAAWAAHSQLPHRVAAALLVAPPDLARADLPPQLLAWAPVPRQRLPFPSAMVLSRDDAYGSLNHGAALAAAWGSEVHESGAQGHLNSASDLAAWPQGLAWLNTLLARAGLALVAAATPTAPPGHAGNMTENPRPW